MIASALLLLFLPLLEEEAELEDTVFFFLVFGSLDSTMSVIWIKEELGLQRKDEVLASTWDRGKLGSAFHQRRARRRRSQKAQLLRVCDEIRYMTLGFGSRDKNQKKIDWQDEAESKGQIASFVARMTNRCSRPARLCNTI